jgi:hypothetical protein
LLKTLLLVLFTCFLVFSVRCHTVWRQLLGLRLHREHLRNKKGGDVENGVHKHRCVKKTSDWVWHGTSCRREQAQLCPINCRLSLAQPQPQKRARCSTAVCPKMLMIREKQSQIPPVPKNYNVTPSPLRTAAPPHFATVYNKLSGGGRGCFVSPSEHPAHLVPALCMFCLLSFVLSASLIVPS